MVALAGCGGSGEAPASAAKSVKPPAAKPKPKAPPPKKHLAIALSHHGLIQFVYRIRSLDGKHATSRTRHAFIFPKIGRSISWVNGHVSMTFTMSAPHGIKLLHPRVYFYVQLRGESSFKLMGSTPAKSVSSTETSANIQFQLSGGELHWIACPKQRVAVGMGIYRHIVGCGEKALSMAAMRDRIEFE